MIDNSTSESSSDDDNDLDRQEMIKNAKLSSKQLFSTYLSSSDDEDTTSKKRKAETFDNKNVEQRKKARLEKTDERKKDESSTDEFDSYESDTENASNKPKKDRQTESLVDNSKLVKISESVDPFSSESDSGSRYHFFDCVSLLYIFAYSTVGSEIWNHLTSGLFEGQISNDPVFKWLGYSYSPNQIPPNHL